MRRAGIRAGSAVGETAARPGPTIVLILAVWSGLLAGVGEVVLRLGQKFLLGDLLRVSEHFVWMPPTANVVLFTTAAGFLLLLRRVFRRPLAGPRAVVLVFLFLTLLAWILLPWGMRLWAGGLLAAGLAWQLSAPLARRMDQLVVIARRTAPALIAFVLLLGFVPSAARVVRERRALAALPPASAGVSNVILIIWDTVRASSLELYGHVKPTTPHLKALAARGVTFETALATSSWTLPTHASLFTGRLPNQTSVGWYRGLDDADPTLAEALAGAGYRTAGFSANTLYVDWEHGLARGFARFEGYAITPGQILVTSALGARILRSNSGWSISVLRRLLGDRTHFVGRKTAERVEADFLSWLDDQPRDRPFFAFLNYFDAHRPYAPPPPFDTMFGPRRPITSLPERIRIEVEGWDFWEDLSPVQLAAEIVAYEGAIAYLDARLGVLLAELEARGQLDRTLIIVTSDHGEEFGEHGSYEHGSDLYLTQTHVPLVIAGPGTVPAGLRVSTPVSLRDVAATIADLTGVGSPRFPGRTLARHWRNVEGEYDDLVVAELAPGRSAEFMSALLADHLHYILGVDGRAELYDTSRDPHERIDLAEEPSYRDALTRMAATVAVIRSCTHAACCCTVPPAISAPASEGAGVDHAGPVRTRGDTRVGSRTTSVTSDQR